MGDTYSDEFDLFMKDKTISSFHINYDGEHPILICSYVDNYGDLFDEPIDVDFLNEYKDRFKEIFRNIVISDIKDGKKVVIPTFVLNGDVIELIGACNNRFFTFTPNTLIALSSATSVILPLISVSIDGAISLLYESAMLFLISSSKMLLPTIISFCK